MLLWAVMMAIFIFAHPLVRRNAFNFFWLVHQLYVVLYFLCLIHGLARITAEPQFWIFFLIPGIVYTLDKIVTLRTAYMELDILETELLPSDVIRVRFYRPPNMKVGIVVSYILNHRTLLQLLTTATTCYYYLLMTPITSSCTIITY